MQGGKSLHLEVVGDNTVPAEEQTTIRVSKVLQRHLSMISAIEGKTIFSITDTVLTDYVRRFESALGRPLLPTLPRKSGPVK